MEKVCRLQRYRSGTSKALLGSQWIRGGGKTFGIVRRKFPLPRYPCTYETSLRNLANGIYEGLAA